MRLPSFTLAARECEVGSLDLWRAIIYGNTLRSRFFYGAFIVQKDQISQLCEVDRKQKPAYLTARRVMNEWIKNSKAVNKNYGCLTHSLSLSSVPLVESAPLRAHTHTHTPTPVGNTPNTHTHTLKRRDSLSFYLSLTVSTKMSSRCFS